MSAARWTGPRVECWTCGVKLTPEAVVPDTLLTIEFWTMPSHRAFSGFAPGLCGGGGRLLGPVGYL